MIQTQVRRDVDSEQTNMAAGYGNVGTKLDYIPDACHGS